MKKTYNEGSWGPPVFCEQCPNLAMVLIEDSPLCQNCMGRAIGERSESWVMENTRPLDVRSARDPGGSRISRDREDDTDSDFVL